MNYNTLLMICMQICYCIFYMGREYLKKAGLKSTLPRLKILQLFEQENESHFTAEDIHAQLLVIGDNVGLATVYRVLNQFEEAGIIIKHRFDSGQSIYELNTGEHHDHLVCMRCNKVIEFVDDIIEERQAMIADKHGFSMNDHSLNIYGICKDCQTAT